MLPSARFYLCARCRSQAFICSRCDRGQIYCTERCAATARHQSQHEARQRYNKTRRARTLNAERQHRYRLRQTTQKHERVTDQGFGLVPATASSSASTDQRVAQPFSPVATAAGIVVCVRCACECAASVRLGFLKPRYRRRVVVNPPP